MADLTIESLSIEISAEAQSAINTTKRLTEKLRQLKQATSGGLAGAAEFAKGMREIASAARSLNNVDDTKLKNTAEALKALSSLRNVGDLTNTAAQMKNLKKITESINSMPLIGQDKLQNIRDISTALSSLSSIPAMPDLSGVARSVSQLTAAAAAIQQTNMGDFSHKIKDLAKALRPLTTLGKTNLSSFINSLRRLPEITAALSSMDMGAFATQIQRVSAAIAPLVTQINTLSTSLTSLPPPIQNAVAALLNYSTGAQQAGNSTNSLLSKIKNLLNIGAVIATFRRLKSVLGGMVESSNAYVENLNLFTVSMGNAADEALNFANRVNQLMGIDVSQWIENQGYFKQIASGFGVVEDKANLMSQNLTQLGYDISSFYNISVESAMQKLQSGISGEIMPLRSLGYALDEATLKQVAYNHGITESLTNMSQAQKSQIRYLAIMEQSKNALGDMARTIESPANQLRIFSQRVDQLKRAIGNGLMPIISAALPYVTALVRMLTEGAQKIADFLGFEIPVFDYGDLIAAQNADISSSFDEATSAAKEFQGSLSSIDQLNIIGSEAEKSAAAGTSGLYDLNVDLPTYDFLGGLSEQADDAYNTLKNFWNKAKPYLEAIGAGFATMFVTSKISGLVGSLKKISTVTPFLGKFAAGLTGGVTALVLFKDSVKKLMTGQDGIVQLGIAIGGTVAAIGAFVAFGNPVGAVITAVGAAVGIVWGAVEAVNEEIAAQNKLITDSMLYKNGGTKISDIANAYSDWADNARKLNQQTIDKYNQLGQYDDEMAELVATMEKVTKIDLNLDEITPADAEALRQPFNDLITYLDSDFKERTQTVADDIRDIFAKLGLDEVVSSQVGQAYTEMQERFERNLTESQTVVDEYLKKIQSGGVLSEAEKLEFSNEYSYVIERAKLNDASYSDYTQALKAFDALDLSKIDFESDTTAIEAMQSVLDSSKAYEESIKLRYKAEEENLDKLRQYTEFDYQKGKLSYDEYRQQLDLLDFSQATFELNQEAELQQMRNRVGDIVSAVHAQLGRASAQVIPNETQKTIADLSIGSYGSSVERIAARAEDVAELAQELASGDWLNNNETYKKMQELSDWLRQDGTTYLDVELNVDSQYYDTFEMVKAALNKETFPLTIDVEPKINTEDIVLPDDIYDYVMGESEKTHGTSWGASWRMAPSSLPSVDYQGPDPNTLAETSRTMNEYRPPVDVNVNLHSTVELDGDEIGYATAQYNNNQMIYSNGITR